MQVGAFMQVMNDDARTLSAITGLKLKMAGDCGGDLGGGRGCGEPFESGKRLPTGSPSQ
jgi:hypothetical protein